MGRGQPRSPQRCLDQLPEPRHSPERPWEPWGGSGGTACHVPGNNCLSSVSLCSLKAGLMTRSTEPSKVMQGRSYAFLP